MCVTSAVMDQYRPWIPYHPGPVPTYPNPYPNPNPFPPSNPYPAPPTTTPPQVTPGWDNDKLKELLESFRKAVEAAEAFDRLTGQPDCVDPEKAELEERVAELERRLEAIDEGRWLDEGGSVSSATVTGGENDGS